jgi:hypothetical protein
VAGRPAAEPAGPGPNRRDDLMWMATKGTSWFLRRSVDLIPYLFFMAARDALLEPRQCGTNRSVAPSAQVGAVDGGGERARSGAGEAAQAS